MEPLTHRILPKQAKQVRRDLELLKTRSVATKPLVEGDQGKVIEALQRHLRAAGLGGSANGVFDGATIDALKKFQRAEHLAPTGALDPATYRELRATDLFVKKGFKTAAREGQRGADIAGIEKKLQRLHFNVGKRDGIFDRQLEQAVVRFQRKNGIKKTGRIGEGTAREVNEDLKVQRRLAHSPKLRKVRDLALMAKRHGIPAELPIMTALVESNFKNLSGGDRDSVGMFQQRDAWGPFSVRHDPRKSCRMFLEGGRAGQPGAVDYRGRYAGKGSKAYGQWCQAVQVSAFPDRYQTRLGEARKLLKLAGVPFGLKKH